jgi:D-sedoheptulose 7-phosphate isomerase
MGSEAQPFRSIVETQARELLEVVQGLENQVPAVLAIAEATVTALKAGNKILCAGNGGSAADALHMAEELVGRYKTNRIALPAISLAADITAVTCIGNDFGFDKIFSRQIEALGAAGDLLVLFSTSGGSENLLAAARIARERKVLVVGFLGKDGGPLAPLCDLKWIVPSKTGARIQELHTWAMHCVLECVETAFPA